MAPQASLVNPSPTAQYSAIATPGSAQDTARKPWVPVTLCIFLGICLAYTLSYILYRIIMARRRDSDIPDAPDRGVSQFMNGARLTLNLGQQKSGPLTATESPDIPDEKPLTASSHPAQSEIHTSSPRDSSSPLIITMPSLTIHSNQDLDDTHLQAQDLTGPEPPRQVPAPAPAHQPFVQRVAAKLLSRDRAEAIALDPKLAPVQGPLRPLSTVPSPSRKKRVTLFGLGLKCPRGHGTDPETESDAH